MTFVSVLCLPLKCLSIFVGTKNTTGVCVKCSGVE